MWKVTVDPSSVQSLGATVRAAYLPLYVLTVSEYHHCALACISKPLGAGLPPTVTLPENSVKNGGRSLGASGRGVGVAVGAGVGVSVAVGTGVGVGVAVGSGVGVGVAVGTGVGVGIGVGVAVGLGVSVGSGVGVGVSVGAGVGVGTAVAVGTGVSVGMGVGVGSVPQAATSTRATRSRPATIFVVLIARII